MKKKSGIAISNWIRFRWHLDSKWEFWEKRTAQVNYKVILVYLDCRTEGEKRKVVYLMRLRSSLGVLWLVHEGKMYWLLTVMSFLAVFILCMLFILRAVSTVQEVMALVYYGMQRRHEDATMVHAHSSRSHLIVQLTIYTITQAKPSSSSSLSSDAAPSPPGTPTRSRRTLPQPSAGHISRSQSPAPRSKAATRRSR